MAKNDVHHPREVLVELRDERFGISLFGDGREAADVGEEHRHLSPRAAELRAGGILQQLLVDVLRHVSAEETFDFPLLTVLDEVLIGGAGEQRDRHTCHGLDHRQPETALERVEAVPPPSATNQQRRAQRARERQQRGGETDENRAGERRRDRRAPGRRTDEQPLQHVVRHRRVQLDAGHCSFAAERRLEDVDEPRGGEADKDDLVLELRGIDHRRRAVQDLILRHDQMSGLVRLVRTITALEDGGRPVVDQHRELAVLAAPIEAVVDLDQRHRTIANAERGPVGGDLIGADAGGEQRRGNADRRHVLRVGRDEGRHPPGGTVGIERHVVVAESARAVGQLLKRRNDQGTPEDPRAEPVRRRFPMRRRDRLLSLGPRVDGVGEQDHVSGFGHRGGQGGIRFLAAPDRSSIAADPERDVALLFPEPHVDRDDLRGTAREIVDQAGGRNARPRPASESR